MFLFALAERLHMTVGQLLANADSEELSEWIAYENVKEPSESWYQFAQQNHLISSMMLGKKAPPLHSFLPKTKRPKPKKKISKAAFVAGMNLAIPKNPTTTREIEFKPGQDAKN